MHLIAYMLTEVLNCAEYVCIFLFTSQMHATDLLRMSAVLRQLAESGRVQEYRMRSERPSSARVASRMVRVMGGNVDVDRDKTS